MASEALQTSVPVLRRWAAFDGEAPMPSNFQQWKETSTSQAAKLQKNDPELYQLLSGQAPAGLVADALSNKFSPVPPDPSAMAERARRAEVDELTASNPYAAGNLTAAMRLEQIDPGKAAEMRKAVNYRNSEEKAQDQQEAAEAKQRWMDAARADGQLRSLQAMAQRGGF